MLHPQILLFFCFTLVALFVPSWARADAGCTLIVSYPDGLVIREDGDCDQRRAPASTFKIPLAVMGFDAGILTDATTPAWPYRDSYQSTMAQQKKTTNPTIWLADSIVWYSQVLTRRMGQKAFTDYVHRFNYGNMDVSGNAGKDDGLTQSWLFSSLLISPREQVTFLTKLLRRELPTSAAAQDSTIAIIPKFSAGKWTVHGKTGSGWIRTPSGAWDKNKPQGWFIGWANNGARQIVFARLLLRDTPITGYGGPMARDMFLRELSDFVPAGR